MYTLRWHLGSQSAHWIMICWEFLGVWESSIVLPFTKLTYPPPRHFRVEDFPFCVWWDMWVSWNAMPGRHKDVYIYILYMYVYLYNFFRFSGVWGIIHSSFLSTWMVRNGWISTRWSLMFFTRLGGVAVATFSDLVSTMLPVTWLHRSYGTGGVARDHGKKIWLVLWFSLFLAVFGDQIQGH